MDILYHMGAIFIIWLITVIAITATRRGCLQLTHVDYKEATKTAFSHIYSWVHILCILAAVIIALLLWNPLARDAEEFRKIPDAEVDEQHAPASPEEIKVLNKEKVKQKGELLKKEAEADNNKAMEDATKLFQNTGK